MKHEKKYNTNNSQEINKAVIYISGLETYMLKNSRNCCTEEAKRGSGRYWQKYWGGGSEQNNEINRMEERREKRGIRRTQGGNLVTS